MDAPCIVHNMRGEDYHAAAGLSHSDSKRLQVSPWHYWAMTQPGKPPKVPTAQMMNGTLVHCALLEPGEFKNRYTVAPDGLSKNSNAFKAMAEKASTQGLEVISVEQSERAWAQAEALRAVPEVAELLRVGQPEVSAWWRDPETDVLCKCRPDWVFEAKAACVLLDVKTTTDASAEGFPRSVANFGYHTQADWYSQGYALASGKPVHGFVFGVVESDYPHACAVYMLDDEALAIARERNRKARELFARCVAANQWPGYPSGVQVLSLPKWATYERQPNGQ